MLKRISNSPTVRQGGSYIVIGLLQLLVDWAVFVTLSALGLAVAPANVIGRVSGAVLGFWLNGRFTFAGEDTTVGRRQFGRFLLMWLATTAVSTWSLTHIDDAVGLQWAWLAKPAIDVALSTAGFMLSRHWVYRK